MSQIKVASIAVGGITAMVLLSACSTAGPSTQNPVADLSPIVVAGSTSASSPAGAFAADLDIDDQAGDGTRVAVESVTVGSSTVFVVITDEAGTVLGSDTASGGVQPVSISLDSPISESGEFIGLLVEDDGDGVLDLATDLPVVDDEGESVEEDFDYRVTGTG